MAFDPKRGWCRPKDRGANADGIKSKSTPRGLQISFPRKAWLTDENFNRRLTGRSLKWFSKLGRSLARYRERLFLFYLENDRAVIAEEET